MGAPNTAMLDLPGITINATDAKSGTLELLPYIKPSWTIEDVLFKVFTEGISNKLIGCYLQDDPGWNDMVLIRIHGENSDLIIDRETELKILILLHAAGRAPPVYAKFSNGLCYGFVPGKCPDHLTIRHECVWRLVAKEMARMHAIVPEDYSFEGKPMHLDKEPSVFKKLKAWLEIAPTSFDDKEKHQRFLNDIRGKEELKQELALLRSNLENLGSPVVFCHNDLLLNNIVYNEKTGTVGFIDFEYGSFCYEAHDIGNHFAEFAGVDDVDYSRYPEKEFQLQWLRAYLEYKYEIDGKSPLSVTTQDVERLYVQVNQFALAAHLFWCVWALIQAKYSSIDFDYLGYAKLRQDEYFARKEAFLALELPSSS